MHPDRGVNRGGPLVAGVFTGSAAWWLAPSADAALRRERASPYMMHAINRVSGAVIFGFGVWMLAAARR